MSNVPRLTVVVPWTLAILAAGNPPAMAQTPAQMEYERQQREYRLQQEQQRQEQQRQQQLMQDNARRQQEESSRINAGGAPASGGAAATAQGRGAPSGAGANASVARAQWQKRPALAAEHNPLLGGRWTRPASKATNSADPFAGLQALVKGGLCEALFGGGMFEFRADRLVGMDQRTPEQELDRVEYRGDAKHVVVIPKTTLQLMEFDVVNPDRISWTSQNCVLVRVGAGAARGAGPAGGAATTAALAAPSKPSASPVAPPAASAAGAGGSLALSVGPAAPDNQLAGRQMMVLKEDAQVALIKGGVMSTALGTVLQTWLRACYSHAPACAQGAGALKPYVVGIATTDTTGHAQTPHLPAGRYWVLSDVKVGTKHLAWNQPVDMRAGDKTLTLDSGNAMPVD